jgi:pullulanase/glycogen debranching enzyme
MQKCRVIDPAFTWGSARKPETPWERIVAYEMHVRGFTKLHPLVPDADRGTFAGLANPSIPAYLRSLGVTSAQLLPRVNGPRARDERKYQPATSVVLPRPSANWPTGPST